MYVRSTDVNRCLMSAQSVLASLFPPEGVQKWNDSLDWQPVPVHTVPECCDHVRVCRARFPVTFHIHKIIANLFQVMSKAMCENLPQISVSDDEFKSINASYGVS